MKRLALALCLLLVGCTFSKQLPMPAVNVPVSLSLVTSDESIGFSRGPTCDLYCMYWDGGDGAMCKKQPFSGQISLTADHGENVTFHKDATLNPHCKKTGNAHTSGPCSIADTGNGNTTVINCGDKP